MKENEHQLHIRIPEEEYQTLLQQKDFLGIPTVTKLIRMYINTGICYRIDYTEIHELATQISRIGNNINQIAFVANSDKKISPDKIDEVLESQKEILSLLDSRMMEETKLHRFLDDNVNPLSSKKRMDG